MQISFYTLSSFNKLDGNVEHFLHFAEHRLIIEKKIFQLAIALLGIPRNKALRLLRTNYVLII